ncbi:MAG: hypothetical protein LAN63_10315 [Acidobacteriia bacterium]|nr:hypothetical protein [Terriglobia bacterium]
MPQKGNKPRQRTRPPRIRVPNSERALFVVDDSKFVGVIQRLSLTGGSAILAKGPIPQGTLARMGLNTVFGQVTAQIEFLQLGADGIPLAQAFRFVAMSDISSERFTAAVTQMESAGFSDFEATGNPLGGLASQSVSKLWDSIRRLSAVIAPGRQTSPKS